MLAEQEAGGGIEEADMMLVPLDGDLAADPPGRRSVVGRGDLDAAVEMHGAGAVRVVAKGLEGQRPEVRLLLGEHGGDLALGGAVEGRRLGVAHGRLDLPLAIGMADATGQRHGAVVREHVPVERVQGGIVDVGREHALLEVIEDGGADGHPRPAR
jgi:hypothetical protein